MAILRAIDIILIGFMLLIGINHLQDVVLLKNIQTWQKYNSKKAKNHVRQRKWRKCENLQFSIRIMICIELM